MVPHKAFIPEPLFGLKLYQGAAKSQAPRSLEIDSMVGASSVLERNMMALQTLIVSADD